jgi:hypothetical protein
MEGCGDKNKTISVLRDKEITNPKIARGSKIPI